MASPAQVGRGVGSALGLFLGLREGDRRRKKQLKAKADLDEEALQRAIDKELRDARLKIFLGGDLAPEQERGFLTTQGFEPTAEQEFFKTPEPGSPGFEKEMARRRDVSQLKAFDITGQAAVKAGSTGATQLIRGLERTPGDIADVGLTKARTKTQESIQDVNEARVKSFNALELKRKRVESARGSGKKSEQMSALRTLQSGFVTRIKSLDRIIEFDPFDAEEGTNTARQERAGLLEELLGVTKELRTIGGVKETKIPKRINQSDITKMSTKELKDELIKSLTEK